MEQPMKTKLEKVVELVDNTMTDPDIDITYCIPDVAATGESCDVNEDPYIYVKYSEDNLVERRIPLKTDYLQKSAEEIANLVTFHIEQFKEEVDSLHYGAQ